jgi:hypothetical protein
LPFAFIKVLSVLVMLTSILVFELRWWVDQVAKQVVAASF